MARWEPGARDRLETAALELFAERGFANTTVPQIAERAGVTTRTYFRHFADKREVLFAGEDELPLVLTGMLAGAPLDARPMGVIGYGLVGLSAYVEPSRDRLRARRLVIQSDAGLRERELGKTAGISGGFVAGFRQRGADRRTADLAARLGMAIFQTAVDRWLAPGEARSLAELVSETLELFDTEFALAG